MMNRVWSPLLASCCLAVFILSSASGARAEKPAAGSKAPTEQRVDAHDSSSNVREQTQVAPGSGNEAEAATRFKQGLELFEESEFALALIEFTRAYELSPNFRALYNMGLVNIQLGRYANATRAFEQYLSDGGNQVPKARRDEVETYLTSLKQRTATIELVSSTPGVDVVFDGQPLGKTPFSEPLKVDAGEHTLRASAAGFEPKTFALTLAGRDEKRLELELERLQQSRARPLALQKPTRKLFWPGFVAAGVIGAGAIAGGAIMFKSQNDLDGLKGEPGSSSGAREDAAHRANAAALSADILTGVALATAGVSLYLSLRKERHNDAPIVSLSPRGIKATLRF